MNNDSNVPDPSGGGNVATITPPTLEEVGEAFGAEYRIRKLLGHGGMGAVFLARQAGVNREVAIKVLPASVVKQSESGFDFVKRFEQEAHAMARLSHPNIVSVYDFGETASGMPYIVMEYVDGMNLHTLINHGELTQAHALSWVSQICDALHYAHTQGMVHRDIKPANVLIDREGRVKLVDFGLVKVTRKGSLAVLTTEVAMGTPEFAAPEVLEEEGEVDHRADIYSLGVLMYQMLTGKIPRGHWAPPSQCQPGVDRRFDSVVKKSLKTDPLHRYQCMSQVGEALYEISSGAGSDAEGLDPNELFKMLDLNGDGKVTLEEFQQAHGELREEMHQRSVTVAPTEPVDPAAIPIGGSKTVAGTESGESGLEQGWFSSLLKRMRGKGGSA